MYFFCNLLQTMSWISQHRFLPGGASEGQRSKPKTGVCHVRAHFHSVWLGDRSSFFEFACSSFRYDEYWRRKAGWSASYAGLYFCWLLKVLLTRHSLFLYKLQTWKEIFFMLYLLSFLCFGVGSIDRFKANYMIF